MNTLIACLAMLLSVACSPIPPHPEAPASTGFSDSVVRAHLKNLAQLGSRSPGSEPDIEARFYLEREFALSGVTLEVLEEGEFRHLVGEIPGVSKDSVLLVAPYATLGSDEWVDDSGAVLLLELTRSLSQQALPYTLRIALANVRESAEDPSEASSLANPSLRARGQVAAAGVSLVRALDEAGHLSGLRAVITFEPRARFAPRMARDLRSHPIFRSLFWEVAAELGYAESFPSDAGWRSPLGLQAAFQDRGIGQVLSLVDETTARVELQAGIDERPASDPHSIEGLGPVGSVTLEALARLMRRFERIDAFSQ